MSRFGIAAALVVVPVTGAAFIAAPLRATAATPVDSTGYQLNAAHTGVSTDPVGPQWSQLWTVTLGGPAMTPVIAGGQVFGLNPSPAALTAYNARTGAVDWSEPVSGSPVGIAYDGGRVFVTTSSAEASLTAFDAGTGSVDWSDRFSYPEVTDPPTAAGGYVYVDDDDTTAYGSGVSGTYEAYNESTGARVWSEYLFGGISAPTIDSGRVYVRSESSGQTEALDAVTGATDSGGYCACGPTDNPLVVADGDVFADGEVYLAGTSRVVRGYSEGSSPAVDSLFDYTEDDGTLRAESASTGALIWSTKGDGGFSSPPIEVNGVVYEGSSTNRIFGYSALTGQPVSDLLAPAAVTPASMPSSNWSMAEGNGVLAVPAGDTLTVYGQIGATPAAPSAVSAMAGAGNAVVGWTVPADNGNPITAFTITPLLNGVATTPLVVSAGSAGSMTDPTSGATDQATVPSLTAGSSYSFAVAADSSGGQGTMSAPSTSVTPESGPTPPPPVPAPDDATAFQLNPAHTGASTDAVGPDWSRAWSKTESGSVGTPIVADNQVFALVQSVPPTVVAYQASTGIENWSDAVGSDVIGLTYQGGRLFVLSSAVLTALDSTTGDVDWSTATARYYTSAPTAANGMVYEEVSGGGFLTAYSQSTGAEEWGVSTGTGGESDPSVDANAVYVDPVCDGAQKFDPTSGSSIWTASSSCRGQTSATVVDADGKVFLRDAILYAGTGSQAGSLSAGPPPAVDGTNVYYENGGVVEAQSAASGTVLWTTKGDGGLQTAPLVVNGIVYDGSSSGNLLGFSAETGTQVADLAVGTSVGSPAESFSTDSDWSLAEGDNLLAVPAADTLSVYSQTGTPPASPTSAAAAYNHGVVTVSWTVPADGGGPITDFAITPVLNGTTQTPIVIPAGSATSTVDPTPGASDQYSFSTLDSDGSYTFTVAAQNSGGQSAQSAPTGSIAFYAVAGAPTSVSAAAGQGSAQISWVAASGNGSPVNQYTFTAYENGNAVASQTVAAGSGGVAVTPGTEGTYVFGGLADGTPVTFTVQAVNAAGSGPASSQSNSITPTAAPAAPFAPGWLEASAGPSGQQTATVYWVVPPNNGAAITEFKIIPFADGVAQTPVMVTAGAVHTALDPTPGTTDNYTFDPGGGPFTFEVAAVNSAGTGNNSVQTNAVTLPTVPSAPTSISATAFINTTARVYWTVPSNGGSPITGYAITPIDNGVAGQPVKVTAGTSGSELSPDAGAMDSYEVTDLGPGSYTFTVAAVNANGIGPASLPSTTPVESTAPYLKFSSYSLTFGAVPVGDVETINIQMTNTGNGDSGPLDFINGGADPNDYQVIPRCDGIAPGATCEVTVEFYPGTLGARSGQIDILGSNPNPITINVQGQGTEGYELATAQGLVRTFGNAPTAGDLSRTPPAHPVVGIASTGDGFGYWMVTSNGTIFSYGDARPMGGLDTRTLNSAIVGIAATPDGGGYWLVAANGAVFGFGDAHFYGGMNGRGLTTPIVGMAATTDGGGYWLVAANGGVFGFGDAHFHGSLGGQKLSAPIVSITGKADDSGYWLVAANGGVFSFNAPFHGSLGGRIPSRPITGIAPAPDGNGYWLVGAGGGIFNFGSAPFLGSAGGQLSEVVGITPSSGYTRQAFTDKPAWRSTAPPLATRWPITPVGRATKALPPPP